MLARFPEAQYTTTGASLSRIRASLHSSKSGQESSVHGAEIQWSLFLAALAGLNRPVAWISSNFRTSTNVVVGLFKACCMVAGASTSTPAGLTNIKAVNERGESDDGPRANPIGLLPKACWKALAAERLRATARKTMATKRVIIVADRNINCDEGSAAFKKNEPVRMVCPSLMVCFCPYTDYNVQVQPISQRLHPLKALLELNCVLHFRVMELF